MSDFPEPVERYLAEIRAGASDDQALVEASKSPEDLVRWQRNKAFREARHEALMEAGGADTGEEWVMVARWGNTEHWAPRLPVGARDATPEPVAIPPRARVAPPWRQPASIFSLTPAPGTGL